MKQRREVEVRVLDGREGMHKRMNEWRDRRRKVNGSGEGMEGRARDG